MNGEVNYSGTAIDANGSIWRALSFGTCESCQKEQCVVFQQEPEYEWDGVWRCRPCVEDIGKKLKREDPEPYDDDPDHGERWDP